ncbi:MAG: transglycosylase domain-containing protein [Oscillospiraceae bacterium]|nr:transglycosylase domain-containing protein [Oscillospiraceae bacterium]
MNVNEAKRRNAENAPASPDNKAETKKPKKRRRKPLILRFLGFVGTTVLVMFLSFVLLFVVTGSICAIAATAYVVNYMESTTSVSIQELTMSYSTNIYEMNEEGEWENVYHVNNDVKRKPVKLSEVPKYTQYAFVCAEDERFYEHEGVDFQRTLFVIIKFIPSFWNANSFDQGGSTITQQLVKNLTGDNDPSPQRKIREIYRAMQMEKSYSKDEILETYINYIGFGGAASGIEMAADKYFGKTVSELTLAESACLAAIPQSPEVNNPFAGKNVVADNEVTGTKYVTDTFINTGMEVNRKRMEYILKQMYTNGVITFDEYQKALNEHLIFKGTDEYKALHPEEEEEEKEETADTSQGTSWSVDEAIREFRDMLMEERGVSKERAYNIINTGGYQIYSTVNREMQKYVEEKYSELNNLLRGMTTERATTIFRDLDGDGEYTDEENLVLKSGFTAIDYNGNVLCTVGDIGQKKGALGTSFASTEPQQIGSTIKPVSTYGYALYHDYISWGTKIQDFPPYIVNDKPWPTNYSENSSVTVYSSARIPVYTALQWSYNTIPAQILKTYGERNVYDYATDTLGLQFDEAKDVDWAPLTVGSLHYGVTVKNLANAYMVYGNGGYYSKAHIISRIETGDGTLVYAGGDDYKAVIDPETSFVMNKLLQNIVQNGTGKMARVWSGGKEVPMAGKTGTTQDWCDETFVGLNPDFVSAVWMGYKENKEMRNHGAISSAHIWRNIMGEWVQSHWSGNDFPECDSVVVGYVCPATGKIAGPNCGHGMVGYWKSTNTPYCDNHDCVMKPPVENSNP